MSRVLRTSLMVLVVVNLLFVQVTQAVEALWLLPLFSLALLSPLLVRWQESLPYRLVWNAGVLVIFAVLVHDATNTGARYMLKDGLILAAFCQVHLLNNLGRQQKPDLLFFNSFLIALVTCFFSQDLAFLGVFLVYVPCLIVAMQIAALLQHDASPRPGLLPRLVRQSLARATLAMAVTALAFVLVPRDFEREGLVGAHLRFESRSHEIGFSEEVKLDRKGPVTASDRVVLRLQLEAGNASGLPRHWRGATFTHYAAQSWQVEQRLPDHRRPLPGTWLTRRAGEWLRGPAMGGGGEPAPIRLRVELLDDGTSRLFAPLLARSLVLEPPADPMLGSPLLDGTFRYVRTEEGRLARRPLAYRVAVAAGEPTLAGRTVRPTRATAVWSYFDPRTAPAGLVDLTTRLRRGVPPDAEQHEVVETFRAYLSRLRYALPGEPEAATSLSAFLAGQGGGHCEYSATALTLMLRAQRIPCRLVTGFLLDEWNATSRVLTVRSKHAHAWVEVLDPKAGWYTVDPTPPAATVRAPSKPSLAERLQGALSAFWARVTSFDAQARQAVWTWVKHLPARLVAGAVQHPARVVTLVLTITLLVLWRRRGQRVDPAVAAYQRALRRAGLERARHETPREVLARLPSRATQAAPHARLDVATGAHEAIRYGGSAAE